MMKLGATFSLGVDLAAAAFQASIQQNANAINDVRHAKGFLDRLNQLGVKVDPFRQISSRLQDMIDRGDAPQNVIEEIRDNDLTQAYQNLQLPVLLHAYQLGVAIGGAESQTAATPSLDARGIILNDTNDAAGFADSLSKDTPIRVPLNVSNAINDLTTIFVQIEQGAPFSDLRSSLIFVRGKCQGILDVTGPENF